VRKCLVCSVDGRPHAAGADDSLKRFDECRVSIPAARRLGSVLGVAGDIPLLDTRPEWEGGS
jgi:hypothetical protein